MEKEKVITAYTILYARTTDDLIDKVQEYINDDWQPFGEIQISDIPITKDKDYMESLKEQRCLQVMVLKEFIKKKD